MVRYSVDGCAICIKTKAYIEFTHEDRECAAWFLVLPSGRERKILLGKRWIQSMIKAPRYECEINTPEEKRVVESTWTIPKKLESATDMAIQTLLKKGLIKESKSSWVNNIKPVEKADGSVG